MITKLTDKLKASIFDKIRFKLAVILDRLVYKVWPYQRDQKDLKETLDIINSWYGTKSK